MYSLNRKQNDNLLKYINEANKNYNYTAEYILYG